jgi:hypothetical protein
MNLSDLKAFPHPAGFQHKELFNNGYGISVIPESDGEHYEVAVLEHCEGRHAHLSYETKITNDVIRYISVDAVNTLIDRVRNLPSNKQLTK